MYVSMAILILKIKIKVKNYGKKSIIYFDLK